MKVVDAIGARCPLPIIEVAKEVQRLREGESLTLLADDPATEPDLKAWARMTGNNVEVVSPTKFKVTKLVSKD